MGDDDLDGFVDGIFLALGNFPLDSILLPGAPFVQTIQVTSNYPLHALDAAMLSLAAARNHLKFLQRHRADPLSKDSVSHLLTAARERHEFALRHLRRALENDSDCTDRCNQVKTLAAEIAALGIKGPQPEQIAADVRTLDAAVARLAALHKARTGKEVL